LNYNYFSVSNPALCVYANPTVSPVVSTTTIFIPFLPKTGFPPKEENIPWNIVILTSVFAFISISLVAVLKKRTM
jgi:hypothetical protein